MNEMFNLVQFRETIFVKLGSWEASDLLKITTKFENYKLGNVKLLASAGVPTNQINWSLTSVNKKTKICFLPQRIDCIVDIERSDIENAIGEFNKLCMDSIIEVLDIINTDVTRIAIAPLFKYGGDVASYTNWCKKVFSDKYSKFKGKDVLNPEFSQLYRVQEKIGDEIIVLNYLSRAYLANKNTPSFNLTTEQLGGFLSLDINTLPDKDRLFNTAFVQCFFSEAPQYAMGYLKHFTGE